MATSNCSACSDIREIDPSLAVNGWTDTECASFANNTGLNPASGNDDCTDLGNMNDCLIENLGAEVDAYEVCDWKPFMKKFIPNVWTMFSAVKCAICGIWTNIKNLQTNLDKLSCLVNGMGQGQAFRIGEEPTAGSYVVAGKGVSFYQTGSSVFSGDITLLYIAGGLVAVTGSCIFHHDDFTDAKAVVNFDNGSVERTSTSRLGNSVWNSTGKPAVQGELVYEIRIKKSQYPQIQQLFDGFGLEGAGSAYHAKIVVYTEGLYAPGQHGWCNPTNGDPTDTGYDRGHLVPSGWIYVQCRISYLDMKLANNTQYSPNCYCGIRINPAAINC